MTSVASKPPKPATKKHFFGIREPGRLALAVFRLPQDVAVREFVRVRPFVAFSPGRTVQSG